MLAYADVYDGVAIQEVFGSAEAVEGLEIVFVRQRVVGEIDVAMLEAWGNEAIKWAGQHAENHRASGKWDGAGDNMEWVVGGVAIGRDAGAGDRRNMRAICHRVILCASGDATSWAEERYAELTQREFGHESMSDMSKGGAWRDMCEAIEKDEIVPIKMIESSGNKEPAKVRPIVIAGPRRQRRL